MNVNQNQCSKSQSQRILAFMKKGRKITGIEALNLFGCFRLAARINDLKKAGNPINKNMIVKNGKSFAQYYIERAKPRRLAEI